MSTELELAQKTARINELRQKMYAGEGLSDAELQEGLDLVIDVRGMRAGKVAKAKTEDAKKAVDITELF